MDRNSYFAFYNRALTYQLLNDPDNAIKDYSIVLLMHHDHVCLTYLNKLELISKSRTIILETR
jgi:hypothetical protein